MIILRTDKVSSNNRLLDFFLILHPHCRMYEHFTHQSKENLEINVYIVMVKRMKIIINEGNLSQL